MPEFFSSVLNGNFTLGTYLACTAASLLCGLICAAASSFRSQTTKSFLLSLLLLPMIVETVIIMVNGNIGTGVAVMGAFSLVRFRSVPGKAKDIVSIFLSMTAGLACAAGYITIAVLFTILVSAVMLVFMNLRLSVDIEKELRITIPEHLNFSDAFEDIFKEYTKTHQLMSIKTSGMGSLYKLTYRIELKDVKATKEFIDALRTRNGNLEIALMEMAGKGEEL